MINQVPMSRLYKDVSEKVEARWKQLYSQDGPHFEGEYCKQAETLLSNICLLYTSPSPRDRG